MKTKKILAVIVCAALVATIGVLAGCSGNAKSKLIDEGTLKVALNNGYEGFEELNPDTGEYSGVDIDLATQLAEDMGVELEIVDMEFDGVIPAVKAGTQADLGISGITITPDREKEITFSDPYYSDDQSITVPVGSKYTAENYAEDLNKEGVKIYAQLGTTGEDYAKEHFPNAEIVAIPGIAECFTTLAAGNCDAVVMNAAPTKSIVGKSYTGKLQVIDTVATGEEYGIAVNKDNKELLDEVNELLAKYKEDGTLEGWIQKHLG